MVNTYWLAKKIHRWFIGLVVLLTLVQAGTGFMIKYGAWLTQNYPQLDFNLVLKIHDQAGGIFTLVLLIMIITGLWMYFYPIWQRRRRGIVNNDTEI